MRYELLNTTGFKFTQTGVAMNLAKADCGDGYAPVAAVIGDPAGLRSWTVQIGALPDKTEHQVNAFARGKITLVSQPNNNDTMIVGGKTYTFKTAGPVGDQILIGADTIATAKNIETKVTADNATTLCTAEAVAAIVELMANSAGVAGNSIALTTDGVRLTRVAFVNGVMTRAAFLWEFWLRSKRQGNRPFWVEDPKDGLFYLAEFAGEDNLSFEILCGQVYGTGLQLGQRRAADQTTPVAVIP